MLVKWNEFIKDPVNGIALYFLRRPFRRPPHRVRKGA